MNAVLALEDGTWFRGTAAGAQGEARGEVVFNTSMTGYQEVLTDPSYAGQIVTMTSPQIGNYGVSDADIESTRPARGRIHHARVVAGREQLARRDDAARVPDPPRHRRHRRDRHAGPHAQAAVGWRHARRDRAPAPSTRRSSCSTRGTSRSWRAPISCRRSPARRRTSGCATTLEEAGEFGVPPERRASKRLRIAAYDFGIKQNILRRLAQHNCDVHGLPRLGARRGPARARARRRVPEQRPRRSRCRPVCHRQRQGAARHGRADVRDLPRAPGASASRWADAPTS